MFGKRKFNLKTETFKEGGKWVKTFNLLIEQAEKIAKNDQTEAS